MQADEPAGDTIVSWMRLSPRRTGPMFHFEASRALSETMKANPLAPQLAMRDI
jgi:hypothetical protein